MNCTTRSVLTRIRRSAVVAAVSVGTLFAAGTVHAGDRDVERVAGALFGAVIGSVVGDRLGGRDGAVAGGLIGATVGVVATSRHGRSHHAGYGDHRYRVAPAPVYSAPPVYRHQPRVVQPIVIVRPPVHRHRVNRHRHRHAQHRANRYRHERVVRDNHRPRRVVIREDYVRRDHRGHRSHRGHRVDRHRNYHLSRY